MPSTSAIQGSLDNFISIGSSVPASGVGGVGVSGGSLLGDPSRSLSTGTSAGGAGNGNDSDHWNGLNSSGSTVKRNTTTSGEANDDSEDKGDGWMPENDIPTFDCGEFQVKLRS